jgi:hypothetical protein
MATPQFIASSSEPRIVTEDMLLLCWDAGLHTTVLAYIGVGTVTGMHIAELLNAIRAELIGTDEQPGPNPALGEQLDNHLLRSFLQDMRANGHPVAFTDELPTGARPAAPGQPNVANWSGGVLGISVYFEVPPTQAYVIVYSPNGNTAHTVEPAGTDDHWRDLGVPTGAGAFQVRVAAIDDATGLRGFLSPMSDAVEVTA